MGRYKDSDTLDFLNWLKLKGESLGYIAELDYYLGKKDYFVDVAWKFGKDQTPLVTFEVETMNCGKIFLNTSRIYGIMPAVIPIPRNHFMIVFKAKLSENQKKALYRTLSTHNVWLFEDIFSDSNNRRRLEQKLDSLRYNVPTGFR
jgi:hypothetical protein